MFKIGYALLLFCALPVLGGEKEEIYSVYFDLNNDPGTERLSRIEQKYHNRYTLIPKSETDFRNAAGDVLIADFSGIYIQKNKLLSISREEIRENSQYTIRNGYLLGVIENDSALVALEDDRYYFLIPKRTYLYQTNSAETPIYRGLTTNSFLIFSEEENGYYSALYITFSGQKISLMELDFDQEELDYRTIRGTKMDAYSPPSYILDPTFEEWKKIMSHFRVYDNYLISNQVDED